MNLSINSVSEDKLFLRLKGIHIQHDKMHRAIHRIKEQCSVSIHKLVGSQIIALERIKKDEDLHVLASKFISEIRTS